MLCFGWVPDDSTPHALRQCIKCRSSPTFSRKSRPCAPGDRDELALPGTAGWSATSVQASGGSRKGYHQEVVGQLRGPSRVTAAATLRYTCRVGTRTCVYRPLSSLATKQVARLIGARRLMPQRRLRINGGKTPSEYIFSELPQVADIAGSAFHDLASPLVSQITAFWIQAIPGEL
jgi:hypothetical protein